MNAICKVLNTGQPVLQIMTVLSFVSRVLKNYMNAKGIVKNCNRKYIVTNNNIVKIHTYTKTHFYNLEISHHECQGWG